MTPKGYSEKLTAYNTWANDKIANMVREAGEDRALLEQKSSFSNLKKTILHIHNAQTIWLSRLAGDSPINWPPHPEPASAYEACNALMESSRQFEKLIIDTSDDQFNTVVNYNSIKGDPFSNTFFEIITHVMNHGTYHRGQIVTMLRGAGFEGLSSTDLITWYRL